MQIEVSQLSKRYRRNSVLDRVSFSLGAGKVLALLGPSGSGKSTLLRCLLGLTRADSGTISLNGQDLALSKRHRFLAYLPQHPEVCFNPRWILEQSLLEPFHLLKLETTGQSPKERLLDISRSVGFAPRWFSRYPHEVSGGELQRAALVRAIAASPRFLLADEPTSMLDPILSASVMQLLLGLVRERGLGLLFTTHDPELAKLVADHVLNLRNGKLSG